TMSISTLDLVIIAVYLIGITAIGIRVGYRKSTTSREYFLAGKSLGWFTVGGAMFASNISTIHLVGLAAAGASVGLVMGNFEWMASFCLIVLALFFAPFYFRTGIQTLPQFLERRYSPAARTFLAAIAIFGALLIHIGISLYAGAKLFEAFLGIPVLGSILIISAVTVIYTVLGGLKAVVVTETIQTFLLLGGAVLITVLAINHLPSAGVHSYADFKAQLAPEQLSMIHPVHKANGHLNEYSWLAILLGYPVLGIWYWCSDQTIVQRVLGSRTERDGQNGALFAGFLKILPLFLMVVPGVIALVLVKNGAMSFGTTETGEPDYNTTLPNMINLLVPSGLKGLIAAGLLAALMSTIASALNSCATLISVDIVKRLNPAASDAHQVKAGRISAGVIMVLAILWSTQGGQFGTIFEAINKIPMIFAPAVTTVLVLGVFWERGTNRAALTTFSVGCAIGLAYFIMDMKSVGRLILDDAAPAFGGLVTDPVQGLGLPFMIVGPILTVFCVITYVIVSLLGAPPPREQLENTCWGSPLKAVTRTRITGIGDPRVVAMILCALMFVLYVFLR
ncbi:MAG: sodium/solute symporter, partial [Akkermansiaceae bacterium]|nr:sodium/solute symporter [Akkermansiaceae bacterium]